jgi:hypothetical protein
MINGAHVILYSRDPDADRAFFRRDRDVPGSRRLHPGAGGAGWQPVGQASSAGARVRETELMQ